MTTENILEVHEVTKVFPIKASISGRTTEKVKAINGVSFVIKAEEIFGLVGESGCGKSTLGNLIAGLSEPTSGKIVFQGRNITRGKRNFRELARDLQIVFQDPSTSLNPRRTIYQTLLVPLRIHRKHAAKKWYSQKIVEMLELVDLPVAYMDRYPSALSGGQKQRVAIARAISTEPSFLVLDEPTSALDVSVQGKLISLLIELRRQLGLSFLFITHDLSLMRNVATNVAVMYLGKLAEIAPVADFFQNPLHPYSRMLLASVQVVSDDEESFKPNAVVSEGEVPSPVNIPSGCSFHTRCSKATDLCSKVDPMMIEVRHKHFVRCHHWG